MRIAIPINENKGKDSEIPEHFGHVREVAVYDSEKDDLEIVNVIESSGCSPVEAIKDKKVDAIFCHGMGMRAMALCKKMKIDLKTGPFTTIKELIKNINKLDDLDESCGH